MIDFALLPPEVNSARLYAGAGSAPMRTAATAWGGLAVQWASASSSFRTVVAELADFTWRGPSATSMAAAADRYAAWMQAAADAAERTADQARAAAAAFDQAFATIVPPWAVAENRARLAVLVATNFFGQNTPAIAANWVEYWGMWAQDATVMHNYLVSSAAATTLPRLREAPQTTSLTSDGGQANAVAHAVAAQAPGGPSPGASENPTVSALNTFLGDVAGVEGSVVNMPFISESIQLWLAPLMVATGRLAMLGATPAAAVGEAASGALSSASEGISGAAPGPTLAGFGRSVPIGGLSTPPSWSAAIPDVRLTVTASQTAAAVAPTGPTGSPGWLGVPPVAGMANTGSGDRPASGQDRRSGAVRIARQAAALDRDVGSRWMPGATSQGPLNENERNELGGLRREMTELADECDAMARLMMAAMR